MYRKVLFVILLVVTSASVYAEGSDALIVQTMLEKCGITGVTVDDVAVMEEGRVVKLDVSNREVSRDGVTAIPGEIGQLTALRELICTDNSIEVLPPEISSCVNLQKINLASNRLTALPPEIGHLTNLVSLDLRHNSLETLVPELANCVNVEYLWLWGNKLTDIAPVVKLKKLKELYLKDNRLSTLPAGITGIKFKYIDLLGNKLCNLSGKLDTWAKTVDKKYRSTQKCVGE